MAKYRATFFHPEGEVWERDVIMEWEGPAMDKYLWDILMKHQITDCVHYYSASYLVVCRDDKIVLRAYGSSVGVMAEHEGSNFRYSRVFKHMEQKGV